MKGKNFSCNNVTHKRRKSDLYETPYSITRQLLDAEPFNYNEPVLEPACGNGAIVKVLSDFFDEVICGDISTGEDFLKSERFVPTIITNPPFSLAFEFIQKAKQVSEKFAFLLPLSYLHGKQRYDHFYCDRAFPLAKVYCFTRYPMLGQELREDGKYSTGMMVYAWFIWDRDHKGAPTLGWLDNDPYILRVKRD